MKAYRGIRGMTPRVLVLFSRWLVVSVTLWPLYSRERNPVPIEWEEFGPYGRSGQGWRRENLLPLAGFELQIVQRMAGVCMCSYLPNCFLYFLDEWPASILNLLFKESKTAVLSRRHELI